MACASSSCLDFASVSQSTCNSHSEDYELEALNIPRRYLREDIQHAFTEMQDNLRRIVREELNAFGHSWNHCCSQSNHSPNIGTPVAFSDNNVDLTLASEGTCAPSQQVKVDATEGLGEDARMLRSISHPLEPQTPQRLNIEGSYNLKPEHVLRAKHAVTQTMEEKFCDILEHRNHGLPRWISSMLISLILRKPKLAEPSRTGKVAEVLDSHGFHLLIIITIIANIVYMGFKINKDMNAFFAGDKDQKYHHAHTVIEGMFLAAYSVEIIMRMYVHRLYFFVNAGAAWNMFDFVLVLLSLVDFVVYDNHTRNVAFLRAAKFLKVVKVLRVFRAIRFAQKCV